MSEQTLEQPVIKKSKNSEIQKRVERRKGIIKERYRYEDPVANQLARDTIAAELRNERQIKKDLEKEGEIDHLTGIYNRRGFELHIKEELQSAKRHNYDLTILYLDANKFKEINDTFGHRIGDEYLIKIAQAIKTACRSTDVFARLGGDEFAILLSDTKIENVDSFWNRINELFNKSKISINEESQSPRTIIDGLKISAGAAKVDLENCSQSIDQADKAMYKAKEFASLTGENTLIRFDQIHHEV